MSQLKSRAKNKKFKSTDDQHKSSKEIQVNLHKESKSVPETVDSKFDRASDSSSTLDVVEANTSGNSPSNDSPKTEANSVPQIAITSDILDTIYVKCPNCSNRVFIPDDVVDAIYGESIPRRVNVSGDRNISCTYCGKNLLFDVYNEYIAEDDANLDLRRKVENHLFLAKQLTEEHLESAKKLGVCSSYEVKEEDIDRLVEAIVRPYLDKALEIDSKIELRTNEIRNYIRYLLLFRANFYVDSNRETFERFALLAAVDKYMSTCNTDVDLEIRMKNFAASGDLGAIYEFLEALDGNIQGQERFREIHKLYMSKFRDFDDINTLSLLFALDLKYLKGNYFCQRLMPVVFGTLSHLQCYYDGAIIHYNDCCYSFRSAVRNMLCYFIDVIASDTNNSLLKSKLQLAKEDLQTETRNKRKINDKEGMDWYSNLLDALEIEEKSYRFAYEILKLKRYVDDLLLNVDRDDSGGDLQSRAENYLQFALKVCTDDLDDLPEKIRVDYEFDCGEKKKSQFKYCLDRAKKLDHRVQEKANTISEFGSSCMGINALIRDSKYSTIIDDINNMEKKYPSLKTEIKKFKCSVIESLKQKLDFKTFSGKVTICIGSLMLALIPTLIVSIFIAFSWLKFSIVWLIISAICAFITTADDVKNADVVTDIIAKLKED